MKFKNRKVHIVLAAILLLQCGCKDSLREAIGVVASVIGTIGVSAGAVGCVACGAVGGLAFIVQVVAVTAEANLNGLDTASSSPDSNYSSPASVTPVHFTQTGDPVLDQALSAGGKVVDDSRLIKISLQRYYGAVQAQNATAALVQQGATCAYVGNLNADLQTYSTALAAVSTKAQGTPFASITAATADVLNFRDQVVRTGAFPQAEAAYFAQANMTPEELKAAIAGVGAITADDIAQAGNLSGAAIFSTAAQQINNVNASVFLPQGFSCSAGGIQPSNPPPMTGSPFYTQDPNLTDVTGCVVSSTGGNYATFIADDGSPLSSSSGVLTIPYTPTTAILVAPGSTRVQGMGTPGSGMFLPVIAQFSSPVSQIVVFPSLDHVDNHSGNGNGSHGWDAFQYGIYGGNLVGNMVTFKPLFDPTAVIGTDNTTGTPPSYFTLGKWAGTGPTLVNNVLTPGQGLAGTIGYEAYFDFSASGGPYQFYGFTTSSVSTLPGTELEFELAAVAQAAPCGTGFIEVCKASSPVNPVSGDFFFQVTPSGAPSPIALRVPAGACSGPVQVPVGPARITEVPIPSGDSVTSITAYGGAGLTNRLLPVPAPNLTTGTATVYVVPGDVSNETIAVYTNEGQGPSGQLKICKVNGGGVFGTSFSFTAAAAGGTTATYSVAAGTAAQGGNCVQAGTFPVGAKVTVTEIPPPPFPPISVTAVQVSPAGRGTSCSGVCPNSVVATIDTGITEVTFTNKGFYVVLPDRWVVSVLIGGAVSNLPLAFSSADGSAFTISLSGGLPTWLSASITGSTATLAAKPTGLSAGVYEATVTFSVVGSYSTTISVPVHLEVIAPVPAVGGSTPASGSGSSRTFTFQFSHPAGYQNLGVVNVLINNVLDGRHACYLAYEVQNNRLDLVDDAGDAGGPYASVLLGSPSTIQNSQCAVTLNSAQGSGTTLALTLGITFKPAFGGNKITYLAARDQAQGNTNWQASGVWQVPFTAGTITVTGISPPQGTGTSAQFVLTVADSKSAADLGVVNLLINSSIDGRQACYLAYAASTGMLYLVDDAGDAGGPFAGQMPLNGTNLSIANGQCSVSASGSAVSNVGNNMTLTLNISFTGTFAGNQVLYAAGRDRADGNNTGWQAVGTWSVQ